MRALLSFGAAAFAAVFASAVDAQEVVAETVETAEVADGEVLDLEVAAPVVSLDEVIELAGQRAPTMAAARAEVDAAISQLAEARAGSWPSIRVVAGVSPAPRINVELDEAGRPIIADDDRTDLELLDDLASLGWRTDVTVTVPLTTFGRLRLARQAARVGIEAAEFSGEVVLADAQIEAVRAYLALQWYARFERLLSEADGRLTEAEERLEIELEDGDRSARTSLRQLTIVRASFADLRAQADGAAGLARFALERALQLPGGFRVDRFETDIGLEAPPSLDDVLAVARRARVDYERLDLAVAAAELQRRVRRREFAPEIGLNMSMASAITPSVTNLRGPFIYDPYNRFSLGFALGLNWNLHIARGLARLDRADAQLDQVVAEREAAWLGIEFEVTEAYLEAAGRYTSLQAWEEAARASDAWLDQVAFQYDQGLADFTDLEEPLKTYYQTQGTWLKAVLDFRISLARLALVTGTDNYVGWPTD